MTGQLVQTVIGVGFFKLRSLFYRLDVPEVIVRIRQIPNAQIARCDSRIRQAADNPGRFRVVDIEVGVVRLDARRVLFRQSAQSVVRVRHHTLARQRHCLWQVVPAVIGERHRLVRPRVPVLQLCRQIDRVVAVRQIRPVASVNPRDPSQKIVLVFIDDAVDIVPVPADLAVPVVAPRELSDSIVGFRRQPVKRMPIFFRQPASFLL